MSALLFTLAILGAPGEAQEGLRVFSDASLGENAVACATCHATVSDESREGDGLIRAGHTLAGVAKRGFWRGDEKRRKLGSLEAAIGECVRLFMGTDALETKDRRALLAFLRSISDKRLARPDLETGLVPSNDYDRPEFRDGDADRGRKTFFAACHSCHPKGRAGIGGTLTKSSVADVARKTREGNGLLRGKRKPKEWMPAFGRERLTDAQVADIAAYVQTIRD